MDTSALVKRYLREPGSEKVRSLFRRHSPIAVSRLAYAELVAAVARACREKLIGDEQRDGILDVFEDDFRSFDVVEPRRTVMTTVRDLVLHHPLRGYDAVQLASALVLKRSGLALQFWCADQGLGAAATGEGLRTVVLP